MSEEVIDISSKHEGPAGRLSNFTERRFVFRGIPCASIEGVLQAVKFKDVDEQRRVCGLAGWEAKRAGQAGNHEWQSTQILYWQGTAMARGSGLYQQFLEDLYATVSEQCPKFREDLLATGHAKLAHSIGSQKRAETVLTEAEFCDLLTYMREAVRTGNVREVSEP